VTARRPFTDLVSLPLWFLAGMFGVDGGWAGEEVDRFAPPAFYVASFAPEFLDEIEKDRLMLSQTAPELLMAWSELELIQWDRPSLPRAEGVLGPIDSAEAFGFGADEVLETDPSGVVSLVKSLAKLKFWSDRRSGDSLLADLGSGSDHWKVKVKAGPVPAVILRTSW